VGVYYKIQSGSYPEQRKEMEIKYPTLRSTIPALGKETVPTAHTSVSYQNLLVYTHIRNSTIQTTILSKITIVITSRVISRCQRSQNTRQLQSHACNKHQYKGKEKHAVPDKHCSGHTVE